MCSNTNAFVKSVATLGKSHAGHMRSRDLDSTHPSGNVEENNSVSRALSKLSEVEERVETLHQEQVSAALLGVAVV